MKERAILLFILFIILLPINGHGQGLPSAEILTADAAWCDLSDNLTVAEILITGEIDTSRFDLVVAIQGTRDTLVNLPSGIFSLYLNNQLGRNEYIVYKVIEYQEFFTLENDVNDTLIMEDLVTILSGEDTSIFPNAFMWNGSGPTGGHWTPGSDDNTVFHPYVEHATEMRMIIFTRLDYLFQWRTGSLNRRCNLPPLTKNLIIR